MKPVLALLCLAFVVATVRADVPRPKPSPTEKTTQVSTELEVAPDSNAFNAVLQIRKSDLGYLRAALDGNQDSNLSASVTNNRTRTIIAGLLLFVSVSFAGVWLARSARFGNMGRGQKAAAIAIIGVATLGAAAIVTRGNAGPPPSYRWRNISTNLADGKSTYGPVVIQVVPDDQLPDTGAKLILPLKKEKKNGDE
ncbi:MAG TPA: hypothetical protein VI306_20140 [Pyrinomonadaceae bacterium]